MSTTRHDYPSLLAKTTLSGLYGLQAEDSPQIFAAAAGLHYNVVRIDLGRCFDAPAVLNVLGRALRFPEWYGENWDALLDCLTDLSWCEADGHVLILEHADTLALEDETAFETLLDVLRDCCAYWRTENVPCWIFLSEVAGLPALSTT